MKTIEIVQCRFTAVPAPALFDPPQDTKVAEFRTFLAHASRVLHTASHHQPTILQDEGDKQVAYLVTVWPSAEAHAEYTWSENRERLVTELKGIATVEWACLYDSKHAGQLPIKSNIMALTRITVKCGDCEALEKKHHEATKELEKFTKHHVVTGWKVRQYSFSDTQEWIENPLDEDRREFVVFSGYESVEKRNEFVSSPKSTEYQNCIQEYMQWFERRNMRVIGIH